MLNIVIEVLPHWKHSYCWQLDIGKPKRTPPPLFFPSPLPPVWFQDRAAGPRDHEGDGGAPHRGPLRAERRVQILRGPAGLHQGSEQEQRSLHPHDSGLHPPQELLCNQTYSIQYHLQTFHFRCPGVITKDKTEEREIRCDGYKNKLWVQLSKYIWSVKRYHHFIPH